MRRAGSTTLAFLVLLMPGTHLGAAIGAADIFLHALIPLAVVVIIYAVTGSRLTCPLRERLPFRCSSKRSVPAAGLLA